MRNPNLRERSSLFVDLANFYSRIIDLGFSDQRSIRSYFSEWFDFSLLSRHLTNKRDSDIWIFHSPSPLGSQNGRIDGTYLTALIDRFDSQRGVTARDVNIPGRQRETTAIVCTACGVDAEAIWKSEKGIDSSLIVHLFDTVDSWEKAYLISGDADFVPAVRSLRRRGKIIYGAGFSSASKALKKECFEYFDLHEFFKQDYAAYRLFGTDIYSATLENYLYTESVSGPTRVIVDLQMAYDSSQMTVLLESNIIDFNRAGQDFENLGMKYNDGGDSFRLFLPGSFFEFLKEKLAAQMLKYPYSVYSPRITPLGENHRYYLQYEWDQEANKYRLPLTSTATT